MSKYKSEEITKKDTWENLLFSFNPRSFLQSWNWGELNKLSGEKVIRLAIYADDKPAGICQFIFQRARRGPHIIVPAGPLLNWKDDRLVKFFLGLIKEKALEADSWFVRMRPEIMDSEAGRKKLQKYGFIRAPMHLHAENTWVLNLQKSEDEILSGMRKNTRYLVKKSLKMGFEIIESVNLDDINYLVELQGETEKRHGFKGFSQKLLKNELKIFSADKQAGLFLVKYKGEVVVASLIIYYGDSAFYHYSGSNEKARELPASYFLQWEVIKSAKKKGKKYYNFWGIAPEGVIKHRYLGVTTFKKGFGGERIDWMPAMDLPISKLYGLTYIFESVRKKSRGL